MLFILYNIVNKARNTIHSFSRSRIPSSKTVDPITEITRRYDEVGKITYEKHWHAFRASPMNAIEALHKNWSRRNYKMEIFHFVPRNLWTRFLQKDKVQKIFRNKTLLQKKLLKPNAFSSQIGETLAI